MLRVRKVKMFLFYIPPLQNQCFWGPVEAEMERQGGLETIFWAIDSNASQLPPPCFQKMVVVVAQCVYEARFVGIVEAEYSGLKEWNGEIHFWQGLEAHAFQFWFLGSHREAQIESKWFILCPCVESLFCVACRFDGFWLSLEAHSMRFWLPG